MPLIQVTMLKGRTVEQKRKLAARITDAMVEDAKAAKKPWSSPLLRSRARTMRAQVCCWPTKSSWNFRSLRIALLSFSRFELNLP